MCGSAVDQAHRTADHPAAARPCRVEAAVGHQDHLDAAPVGHPRAVQLAARRALA